MVGGKEKGRRKSDARRRYSRRRPRLVGHARAAFARCARRKERGGGGNRVGADRGGWSRVGDRPLSGAERDGGQIRVGCQGGGENGEG
jgi:hypothetical protein